MQDDHFFYANGTEIGASTYDVSLKFLRNGTPKPGTLTITSSQASQVQPVNQDFITIAMSPGHAKAVVVGLANAIIDYEKLFGNVPCLPETQAGFNELFKK